MIDRAELGRFIRQQIIDRDGIDAADAVSELDLSQAVIDWLSTQGFDFTGLSKGVGS